MRELREDTFSGNKNDDAHEQVERVLDVVILLNILEVSHYAVMLRVFPITLTGAAKRWVDRLPPGTVDSWDLLKKAFIQRYCPPSRTANQLEEIRNFKQEGDETLYQAWEWYNDLLYRCPTHDINNHQKVNIFYNGVRALNRQLLDSQGPIPSITLVQALIAIQTMADHSQKWHDGSSSRNIGSSRCQTYEEAHLVKECPLNEEVKGMEEVKYGEFSQPFPNNRYDGRFNKRGYDQPSSREKRPILTKVINKYMEEAYKRLAKQDEWLNKFYQSREASRETHNKIIQGLEGKEIEYFSANSGFSDNEEQETDNSGMAEAVAALEAILKKKREEPKIVKQNVNYYVDPYEPLIPFPKRLEHHTEEALVHQTMESLKKIKINRPLCSTLLQNHLPPKEQDPGSFILPCSIGKLDFKNALADLGASISIMTFSIYKCLGIGKIEPINMLIEMADNTKCAPKGIVENLLIKIDKFIFPVYFVILNMVEDFRMPIILGRLLLATAHAQVDIFRKTISLEVGNLEECGEDKANTMLGVIHDKLNNEWFNNTSEDEDDLEWILYYLKPRSYDGFIDLDDESYNKRRCRLLGMTYEEPTPILIEKAKVTRYTIGLRETYTKVKVLGIEKIPRTRDNVVAIRARLMRKMAQEGNNQAKTFSLWRNRNSRERILKDYWRERFGDEEDDLEEYLEDPEERREDKENTILGAIHDKLNNDWFNNTIEDEDDLEGILGYLKPRSYGGFIDLDDEAYNKRRCRLLGMTYEEPTLILIEKAKVTRYTVGPGEAYTKV
ncbi:hypothetical protein Tco_0885554 [Tanacetum coccineum]